MKKIFILAGLLLALCGQSALADGQPWCLVTETGNAVAMSQVSCLVAADDDVTFSVVLKNGSTLSGVQKATFAQREESGIEAVTSEPIRVNSELSLEGVEPNTLVRVYATNGKLLRETSAQLVKLSDLPSGIYIIKVNETSFKIAKQ